MDPNDFWFFPIIILSNLVVGASIGVSGFGGFFLPVVYSTILGMDVRDGLLLSFFAFLLSGLLGAYRYRKLGYIRTPFALRLGAGCLVGAILGIRVNFLLPADIVKGVLYFVVLAAGVTLLIKQREHDVVSPFLNNTVFVFILGLITGTLCSLSGAGGALILVPVLVALGEKTKYAVGMGILGSVFISIPSSIGYFLGSSLPNSILLLLTSLIFHGLGVYLGSKYVQNIDQEFLRKTIAFLSIFSSLFLFIQFFS